MGFVVELFGLIGLLGLPPPRSHPHANVPLLLDTSSLPSFKQNPHPQSSSALLTPPNPPHTHTRTGEKALTSTLSILLPLLPSPLKTIVRSFLAIFGMKPRSPAAAVVMAAADAAGSAAKDLVD